jgi:oxidoreductase domain protein
MKVAILGTWHVHAPDYTKHAKNLGEVVGVYEPNAEWRHKFAQKFEINEFSSLEELLNSEAEAVIVCASTDIHADVMVAAANSGKHIFTEKVLALTVEDCLRVKEAVEKNGVRFVISYPQKKRAEHITVKKIVDSGKIGQINYVRFRNCHSGSVKHWLPAHFYNKEQCGGGAMIDLGAHGMYVIDWLLGEPKTYCSTFTHACRDELDKTLNPDGIEDNAVTVMSYDNGCIAVNETGFVSQGCPMTLEVGGSLGYITCKDGSVIVKTEDKTENAELCPAQDLPIVSFLKGDIADGCGIDEAITLTKMMVGAYKK